MNLFHEEQIHSLQSDCMDGRYEQRSACRELSSLCCCCFDTMSLLRSQHLYEIDCKAVPFLSSNQRMTRARGGHWSKMRCGMGEGLEKSPSPAQPRISFQSPPTRPRRLLVGREKRRCFAVYVWNKLASFDCFRINWSRTYLITIHWL